MARPQLKENHIVVRNSREAFLARRCVPAKSLEDELLAHGLARHLRRTKKVL